jgi:PKHD-type hydroxylase
MSFGNALNERVSLVYARSEKRPALFAPDECDRVIAWGEKAGWSMRKEAMSAAPDAKINRRKQREIDPRDAHHEMAWFAEKLHSTIFALNHEIWHFNITHLSEIYVFRYDVGDHFSLHADLAPEHCDRKIGVLVQLSDGADYEGGVLEYGFAPVGVASRRRGSILAFPAWMPHRISPITSGVRYSAACFALGPSFR